MGALLWLRYHANAQKTRDARMRESGEPGDPKNRDCSGNVVELACHSSTELNLQQFFKNRTDFEDYESKGGPPVPSATARVPLAVVTSQSEQRGVALCQRSNRPFFGCGCHKRTYTRLCYCAPMFAPVRLALPRVDASELARFSPNSKGLRGV